jgi:hypothetical protein
VWYVYSFGSDARSSVARARAVAPRRVADAFAWRGMGGRERGRGTVVSRSGDETNDETTDPATEDGDARARRARAARAFVA